MLRILYFTHTFARAFRTSHPLQDATALISITLLQSSRVLIQPLVTKVVECRQPQVMAPSADEGAVTHPEQSASGGGCVWGAASRLR